MVLITHPSIFATYSLHKYLRPLFTCLSCHRRSLLSDLTLFVLDFLLYSTAFCILLPYGAYPAPSCLFLLASLTVSEPQCWSFIEQYLELTWGHCPLPSTISASNASVWWTCGQRITTHIHIYIHTCIQCTYIQKDIHTKVQVILLQYQLCGGSLRLTPIIGASCHMFVQAAIFFCTIQVMSWDGGLYVIYTPRAGPWCVIMYRLTPSDIINLYHGLCGHVTINGSCANNPPSSPSYCHHLNHAHQVINVVPVH